MIPSLGGNWGWSRWLVPVAALLLLTAGIYIRQYSRGQAVSRSEIHSIVPVSGAMDTDLNDEDLLQSISQQSPALQAAYADNLRQVNQYIRDAKSTLDADPSDEDARRSLMDAYRQKAVLFELAMNSPLE